MGTCVQSRISVVGANPFLFVCLFFFNAMNEFLNQKTHSSSAHSNVFVPKTK